MFTYDQVQSNPVSFSKLEITFSALIAPMAEVSQEYKEITNILRCKDCDACFSSMQSVNSKIICPFCLNLNDGEVDKISNVKSNYYLVY